MDCGDEEVSMGTSCVNEEVSIGSSCEVSGK